jgi:tetratricopeptide (TPR) repeat protein
LGDSLRLMMRFAASLSACLLALAIGAGFAGAQETGPSVGGGDPPAVTEVTKAERIDTLLDSLKAETDPDAASEMENAILALWLESDSDTVDLLMQWTLKAMEEKQYPRALDFLDRVILLEPGYVEGWNKRATVYFLMDDYGQSIADIGKVLEIEPRHFGALSGLGIMMRAIGDDDRAIAAFREALAIDPHLKNIREELDSLEAETAGEDT